MEARNARETREKNTKYTEQKEKFDNGDRIEEIVADAAVSFFTIWNNLSYARVFATIA
jgi:hypothetical protein